MRVVLAAALIYVAAIALAFAIDDATIAIERVSAQGWVADGIEVRLHAAAQPLRADARVSRIEIPKFHFQLGRTQIHCGTLDVTDESYVCKEATIATSLPELGEQRVRAQLRYERRSGAVFANLQALRVGAGTANIALVLSGERAIVEGEFNRASIQPLAKLAARLGVELPIEVVSGDITGTVHVQSRDQQLDGATIKVAMASLTLNNAAGTIATDKLSATLDAQLKRSSGAFIFDGHLRSQAGQTYFDPLFMDTAVHSFDLRAQGQWRGGHELIAESFTLKHEDVISASGSTRLDLNAKEFVRDLAVANARVQFPGAYETYMQPFVTNDALKALRTSGTATFSAQVSNSQPKALQINVQAFNADGGKEFRVEELQGALNWQANELTRDVQSDRSSFSWRNASVFGLQIGAARLNFEAGGHAFRLLEPARVPLLDGALDIETLRIRNFAQPNVSFLIDATLEPVSVPQLCRAFGWPEFGGHIGGAISKLRMRDGVITLGTTLEGRVFDGAVTVRDLRLEQPFGNWPRFHANFAFDNLDLEQVTSAFSFGRITGKLSGSIDGLELFNWSPVTFDARFFTPANDRSKHRISQRAVESIGSLGGGAGITAALSSSFLRFFSDFNYDRIGVSCRLENDVCVMEGVAPAPHGGYYLVQGRGVPRIDVIGNSRRVDWPRLVQQLKAATEADSLVVK